MKRQNSSGKVYKEAYVPDAPRRCFLFPKRLSDSLTYPVAPALKRRGFSKTDLLRHWEAIVGPELGARCQPVKLVHSRGSDGAAALHIRTRGVWATEIQHNIPQILEKLASYYGYRIATRIVILQA